MFKIRGTYSNDDRDYLYWNNDLGWSGFRGATVFDEARLKEINLPIESTALVFINKLGQIRQIHRLISAEER